MFSPPDYSSPASFLKPRRGPWSMFLYLHRQPIIEAVKAARPKLVGRLLDVGCGDKPYASVLQCEEHVGVDVRSSSHSGGKIDVIYDGATLPFEGESFDSILCTEVLEHCLNPQSLVREMARVMKPGGCALLTAPMVFHHHEEPWDFQRFTRYGMEHIARQAGLEILWLVPRGRMYSALLGTVYTTVSYTLSRRPFIDIVLWFLWPIATTVLWLERMSDKPVAMSLGWQMCVQKPISGVGTPKRSQVV